MGYDASAIKTGSQRWLGRTCSVKPGSNFLTIRGTSTLLDQTHNAIDRKLFMMKGFHHPKGNQQAFLRGLAHLYNLVPYQRRAKHAGQCGVEVEGGTLPTSDWFLNLQILTSGGFR